MTRTLRSPRTDRTQYAPASEAADLSRLLDPSYTRRPRSPTSSTHSSSSPRSFAELSLPRVYVDHDGAMHDPDFRMFPALPTPPSRKDSHSTGSSGRLSPLLLTPPPMMEYRRPSWEQTFGLVESPVTTTSSHSHGEDAEEHQHHHHYRFFKCACRSHRSGSTPNSSLPSPRQSFEEDYTYSDEEDEDDAPFPHTPEPTHSPEHKPAELSGKEAIKYHTKALQLSVQLGVFRAKRRWRERKGSPQAT